MDKIEIFGVPSFKQGSGIHIKEENKGKFTDYCGGKVTDECIQRGKNSSNPTTRKRATFADNARKWKHKDGAKVHKPNGHRSVLDNGWIPTKELKKKHKLVGFNQNGGIVPKYQNAGKLIEAVNNSKRGCKAGTQHCAQFQNQMFRDNGYYIKGNAWNLAGDEILFNGYDTLNIPQEYDRTAIEKVNRDASKNVFEKFDSTTLDVNQPYIVNMWYDGSPYQETAYNEGNKVYGTHTGVLTYDQNKKRWIVTHNIHDKVFKDDFISLQKGNGKYGVTAVSKPRKSNMFNRMLYTLGFKEGGIVGFYQDGGKSKFHKNWLNQRIPILAKNAKTSEVEAQKLANQQIEDLKNTPEYIYDSPQYYKGISIQDQYDAENAFDNGAYALYDTEGKFIVYQDPYLKDFAKTHERTHAMRPVEQELAITKYKNEKRKIFNDPKQKYDPYTDSSTEVYARLMDARQKYKLDPKKVYTKEDLSKIREQIKKDWGIDETNIFNRYDDDYILHLLNDIAQHSSQKLNDDNLYA